MGSPVPFTKQDATKSFHDPLKNGVKIRQRDCHFHVAWLQPFRIARVLRMEGQVFWTDARARPGYMRRLQPRWKILLHRKNEMVENRRRLRPESGFNSVSICSKWLL